MSGEVHFDGDPATDSARRHMERVLKGESTRKWPWVLAALGGGGLFMLWRVGGAAAQNRTTTAPTADAGSNASTPRTRETATAKP